jgi:hypothetical protein
MDLATTTRVVAAFALLVLGATSGGLAASTLLTLIAVVAVVAVVQRAIEVIVTAAGIRDEALEDS